jgi:hypothetical protein
LQDKSDAYLRGFRDALEKIKRGEIDIDNFVGFVAESNDFNFNAMVAYRTKGALGKKNRSQEPTEPVQATNTS